jgi:stress-induced morphogen
MVNVCEPLRKTKKPSSFTLESVDSYEKNKIRRDSIEIAVEEEKKEEKNQTDQDHYQVQLQCSSLAGVSSMRKDQLSVIDENSSCSGFQSELGSISSGHQNAGY